MDIIVAVDADWGIGKDGDLLQRISADMKYFREKTTGNVLVMGRKTLESFPNKKPLPKRTAFPYRQKQGRSKRRRTVNGKHP